MIKPGDVYEAYCMAYSRYTTTLLGGKGLCPQRWDELAPVLRECFADIAAQLNKQFDCLAREEENGDE